MRSRSSRRAPNRSLLTVDVRSVLDALDQEVDRRCARIEPRDLVHRAVPPLLSEAPSSDDFGTNNRASRADSGKGFNRNSIRWQALLPLSTLAAVLGVVSSSLVFRSLQQTSPKPRSVLTESPVLRPMQFANPAYTADLCYQSGVRSEPTKVTGVYLRGQANALVIIKATFDVQQAPSEPVTGRVANINGKRGLITHTGSNRPVVVQWRVGRTDVRVIGVQTNEQTLVTIARSVKLRFGLDGAQVAAFSAPGFRQDFDANSSLSQASVSFSSCGVVAEAADPEAPRFSLSSRTAWPITEALGNDFQEQRFRYPLVWSGRPIIGFRVKRTYREQ
jgi:hypothetical protein